MVAGTLAGLVLAPAAVLTKRLVNDLGDEQARQQVSTLVLLAVLITVLTGLATATSSLAGIPAYRLAGRLRVVTETELARACARFPGTAMLDDAALQDRLRLAREVRTTVPPAVASTIVGAFSALARLGSFVGVLWATSPTMLAVLLATVIPLVLLRRATVPGRCATPSRPAPPSGGGTTSPSCSAHRPRPVTCACTAPSRTCSADSGPPAGSRPAGRPQVHPAVAEPVAVRAAQRRLSPEPVRPGWSGRSRAAG